MTIATDLRAMRKYMAVHGFQHHIGFQADGPVCFLGAAYHTGIAAHDYTTHYLQSFVGDWCSSALLDAGWTKDDALAVLDIAGDCAEAEGK